jgi:hypothetical protein
MAKHDGDLRHTEFGEHGLVTENAARTVAVRKKLRLQRQEAAGAVTQVDDRQAVFNGDIKRPHNFLG